MGRVGGISIFSRSGRSLNFKILYLAIRQNRAVKRSEGREEWMALFVDGGRLSSFENALGALRVLFLAAGSLFDHKDSIKFEDYGRRLE